LAATFDFTSFFIMAFLVAANFSLQLGCLGLDITSFYNCMLQNWPIAGFGDLLLLVFITGSSVEITVH